MDNCYGEKVRKIGDEWAENKLGDKSRYRGYFQGLLIALVSKVRYNVFPEVEKYRHSSTGSDNDIANKVGGSCH